MKHFYSFSSAVFLAVLSLTAPAFAQNNYTYSAVVAAGGNFEFAPPFTDFVSLKVVTGTNTRALGTVFTQSVQAVLGIGQNSIAVAAEDSLVFFNFNTANTANRFASFGIPDAFASWHTLYTNESDPRGILWAGKWYGSNSNFLYYYSINPLTQSAIYGGIVGGIGQDVRGMAQIGDTLYVSQNIQNSSYTDSISFIAKINTTNFTLTNTFGRNNQAVFLGVSELYSFNGKLYGVCLNSNRIIEYTPTTGAVRTIICGTDNITKTISFADNRLTVLQSGVKRYNITNGSLIEDLTCLVPNGESVVAGLDGFGKNIASTLLSTTDYFSFGNTYTELSNCTSLIANVGIAPEAMTFVKNMLVATQTQATLQNVSIAPNPTTDRINIHIATPNTNSTNLRLVDMTGRMLLQTQIIGDTAEISLAYLPKGVYVLYLQNESGVFVQKIERL